MRQEIGNHPKKQRLSGARGTRNRETLPAGDTEIERTDVLEPQSRRFQSGRQAGLSHPLCSERCLPMPAAAPWYVSQA